MAPFYALARFAGRYPAAYLGCCCAFGLAIRLWIAGGDLLLFIDPRFPLFLR
jgi:hypothetical protein